MTRGFGWVHERVWVGSVAKKGGGRLRYVRTEYAYQAIALRTYRVLGKRGAHRAAMVWLIKYTYTR